jgi:predicted transcriptional regulator
MTRRRADLESLLGPLEQDVMDVAWRLGEATVRDVHAELAGQREIAYTTVMTTMARLARKGMLQRDTADLAHRYRPVVSREQYGRGAVSDMFAYLLDRYPEPAVAYLTDVVHELDDLTLEELREAVARRRAQES